MIRVINKKRKCKRCKTEFQPTANAQRLCGNRILKTGCAYLHYLESCKSFSKNYRLLHRKDLNVTNTLYRRRVRGNIPRYIYQKLLNDSEWQKARKHGLKHTDPVAYEELKQRRIKELSELPISEKCIDCEKILDLHSRSNRNVELCKSCWSERYLKRSITTKDSAFYGIMKV